MEITQKYAVLILNASFQSASLLRKIQNTQPNTPERTHHVETLEGFKACLGDQIRQTEKEIVEAFRNNKAAQLILELG
jgi:hypothetical protein